MISPVCIWCCEEFFLKAPAGIYLDSSAQEMFFFYSSDPHFLKHLARTSPQGIWPMVAMSCLHLPMTTNMAFMLWIWPNTEAFPPLRE